MTIPRMMQAARVHKRGAARFEVEEVPTPEPGPGQVLVRVEAASVNFSDVKRRRGDVSPFETEFPFVPGGEIAGTVVAHGAGVDGPQLGTPVFALAGLNGYGGYAQFAVSYAQSAIPIPHGMNFDAAAVLLIAGGTAKLMLSHAAVLQQGESLLVPAATGGVGSFTIQLAQRTGAGMIIAAVGDLAKRDKALSLGAHAVVNYSTPEWPLQVRELTGGAGVNVALEASGGAALEQTLSCLAPFGRLVVFGAASGRSATLSPAALDQFLYAPALNQALIGFGVGWYFLERPTIAATALGELIADVMAERIRLPDIQTLPLREAARAHELLEARQVTGKLVIKPWE
jgi:NADPH:quinone reductase-like Zn-dependent oxidoreductase